MDADAKKKLRTRANRIAGQVAGVQRMVDEDRPCMEILNQISAVRSALDALGVELLTRHLERCVLGHDQGADAGRDQRPAGSMTKEELLAEIRTALPRFLR